LVSVNSTTTGLKPWRRDVGRAGALVCCAPSGERSRKLGASWRERSELFACRQATIRAEARVDGLSYEKITVRNRAITKRERSLGTSPLENHLPQIAG